MILLNNVKESQNRPLKCPLDAGFVQQIGFTLVSVSIEQRCAVNAAILYRKCGKKVLGLKLVST